MKKLVLLFFLISGFAFSSQVQAQQDYQSAIGLKLGYPLSLTYKTFLNEANALDLFIGYRNYSGVYNYLVVGGFYEFHNDINGVDGLNWYYGFGASVVFISYNDAWGGFLDDNGKFGVGLSGVIGAEYTFADAPVTLSLDFVPTLRIGGWDDGYNTWGSFSVRYILKR